MFLLADIGSTNSTRTLIAYLNLSDQFIHTLPVMRDQFNRAPTELGQFAPIFTEFSPSNHTIISVIDYSALSIRNHHYLHQTLFSGTEVSDGFVIKLGERESDWAAVLPAIQKSAVGFRVNGCAFWFFCMYGETTKIPFSYVLKAEK